MQITATINTVNRDISATRNTVNHDISTTANIVKPFDITAKFVTIVSFYINTNDMQSFIFRQKYIHIFKRLLQ